MQQESSFQREQLCSEDINESQKSRDAGDAKDSSKSGGNIETEKELSETEVSSMYKATLDMLYIKRQVS